MRKELRDFHRGRIEDMLNHLGENKDDPKKQLRALTGLVEVLCFCIQEWFSELDDKERSKNE